MVRGPPEGAKKEKGNIVERNKAMAKNIKIKIKKNEYDEYEVQWLEDGKKNEAKTYYTDDHEDALGTKAAMEKEAERELASGTTKAALQKYSKLNNFHVV